jgi:hypothetical protein
VLRGELIRTNLYISLFISLSLYVVRGGITPKCKSRELHTVPQQNEKDNVGAQLPSPSRRPPPFGFSKPINGLHHSVPRLFTLKQHPSLPPALLSLFIGRRTPKASTVAGTEPCQPAARGCLRRYARPPGDGRKTQGSRNSPAPLRSQNLTGSSLRPMYPHISSQRKPNTKLP